MSGRGSNAGFSGELRRHLAPECLSRDQPRILYFEAPSVARGVTAPGVALAPRSALYRTSDVGS